MSEETTHSKRLTGLPGTIGFVCMLSAVAIMVFPVPTHYIYCGLLLACFVFGLEAAYYGHRWMGAILTVGVLCLIPFAFSTCQSGNRPAMERWTGELHMRRVIEMERINAETAAKLLPDANSGKAYAQYYLGELYLRGKGVPKDEILARELFEKAAAQDYPEAKAALAKLTKGQ